MTKKKGFKQTYFIDDMEIMSLHYNSSSNGIIVAFRNKQGIDFHLTIYYEGLSLFSHVVYKNKKTGEDYRTTDKEFSLKDFLNYITTELGDNFIYHYDEQIMCYTFTDEYLESILGKNNEQGDQDVDVMNAFQYIDSDTDFSNKEQFHYTDITQLPKICPLGILNIDNHLKVIVPIANNRIIILPDDYIEKIFSIFLEGLGFDTFLVELSKRLERTE